MSRKTPQPRRFFVTDPPVAIYEFNPEETVSDDAPSVVWIKARMDVETSSKVKSELFTLGKDGKTFEAHFGANEMALLVHNIVRWEGPLFLDDQGRPVPCTHEYIRKLPANHAFVEAIVEEIALRNKSAESPDPKLIESSGSPNSGLLDSAENPDQQLATMDSKSPLLSAITGRRERSESSTPTILTNSVHS